MPFIFLYGFLLFAAYPFIGSTAAVWVLAGSQLALLVGQISKGQVSGVGGFIFMSFLFFGVRPIYLVVENDYGLVLHALHVRADLGSVGDAMWWASAALLCFAIGAWAAPQFNRRWFYRRRVKAMRDIQQSVVSAKIGFGMLFVQLMTMPVMLVLAKSGRSLYGSSFGAYVYDLPVPLQSMHILAVVVLLERYLRTKTTGSLVMLGISGFFFLYFTWLMRDVSLFRGFYIVGVMIVGIAALQRIKGRVGFAWLIIPVVVVQPFFAFLGGDRTKKNDELAEAGIIEEVFGKQTLAGAYWQFYDSKGDMNIFDTFVAATKAEPKFYPYAMSWVYAPFHIIPRGLWPSKPRRGITQDLTFIRGYPLCPGIAGFFLVDGGYLWMLLSMLVLGYLVSWLYCYILTMPRGYLQYCLIGIITVQSMYLSRAFLWYFFWQMMYAIVPIMLLVWFFRRHMAKGRRSAGRGQGGAVAEGEVPQAV